MKAVLFELLVICLLGALHAEPEDVGEDEQGLRKRYAESAIASEISKIMDSMVQKNFVKFLLSQREKKSRLTQEGADSEKPGKDLLELSLQEQRNT